MIYYSKNNKVTPPYSSCEPNGYTYVDGYGFAPPPPVVTERRLLQWYANGIGFAVLFYFLLVSYMIPFFLLSIMSVFVPAIRIFGNQVVASATAYQALNLLNSFISLLLPFLLFVFFCRIPIKVALPLRKIPVGLCVSGVCISLGVMVIGNFSSNFLVSLLDFLGLTPVSSSMSIPNTLPAILIYTLHVVVLGPLAEEFVFRGIILNTMRRFGDSFALLISAVLFSLFHGNLAQLPNTFIQGLVIGYFVLCTGSLWTGVIIHMANNAVVVLFELVTKGMPLETSYLAMMFLFAVLLAGGIIALLGVVRHYPNMFMFIRSSTYASEKNKYAAFFSAVTMLVSLFVLTLNVVQHVQVQ